MRRSILFPDVVHVVRDHDGHVILLRERPELLVDLSQLRDIVLLELDVPVVRAEHVTVPHQPLDREAFPPVLDECGQLGRQAARGANEALAVSGQVFRIDPGAVVVTSELGVGTDLEEVAVAGHVLGEQQEMVAAPIELALLPRHGPAPLGDIRLYAQQRLIPRPLQARENSIAPCIVP